METKNHHHHAFAHAAHHHLVHHAHSIETGVPWYVGYLLGHAWLPVGLLTAGMLVLLMGRVWGRHRLAAAGGWWELRLGERVSRPALEAFVRTLAGGLPRPLLRTRPWVALSVSSHEDRAACCLFVSGGLSPAQVRAAVEQALGGVTVEAEIEGLPDAGGSVYWRVASLAPVGSRYLPLRVDHRVDPAGQLLGSLRAQQAGGCPVACRSSWVAVPPPRPVPLGRWRVQISPLRREEPP
jgi:hypothetical protein